jgi:hypothetical protein
VDSENCYSFVVRFVGSMGGKMFVIVLVCSIVVIYVGCWMDGWEISVALLLHYFRVETCYIGFRFMLIFWTVVKSIVTFLLK